MQAPVKAGIRHSHATAGLADITLEQGQYVMTCSRQPYTVPESGLFNLRVANDTGDPLHARVCNFTNVATNQKKDPGTFEQPPRAGADSDWMPIPARQSFIFKLKANKARSGELYKFDINVMNAGGVETEFDPELQIDAPTP